MGLVEWFMLCGFGAILFGVRGVWLVWSVGVCRLGMETGIREEGVKGFLCVRWLCGGVG